MSLGDEPVVSQPESTVDNLLSAQRPINCLPTPPSISPPIKQTSLNSTQPANNKSLVKSNSAPIRSKLEKNLSKPESFENDGITPNSQRLRGNPKIKLLQRSHAVREETSPPRESELNQSPTDSEKSAAHKSGNGVANTNNNNNNLMNNNTNSNINGNNSGNKNGNVTSQSNNCYQGSNNLQVTNNASRPNSRHKLKHQGSSQGSMDNSSPCLSRDSSTEQYTDNSGIDLNQFIADTLNRNFKDRMLLLQIEQDLISLVKDNKRAYQKFPVMSSYQRMLVHRVAAFFGMDHNIDQSGHCVVVNITSSTRIPEVRFSELIREDGRFPEEPRRCILKRDSSSFEEGMQLRSPERQLSGDSRRSKSFEEREEEYERARKRIFNRDDGLPGGSPYRPQEINSRSSHEDLRWRGDSQAWSSSDSDICSTRGRLPTASRGNRISKVQSFEGNDTLKANSLKNSVSKSYSFGGSPGMARGDSVSSGSSRALIKQADSVTSSSVSSTRLSPCSSGYKTQSVRSDATTSTTPSPNQGVSQSSLFFDSNTVVWAVSSLTAVPPGAVLINPASGQPYTNPDGSLYRYDPENPIRLYPAIQEDVPVNSHSSPQTGIIESSSESKKKSDDIGNSDADVISNNNPAVFINSSTSPNPPDLQVKENIPKDLDSGRIENHKKDDHSPIYQDELAKNPTHGAGGNPVNYGVGAQYSTDPMNPQEVIYPQPVMYAAGQQTNSYGVVHAPAAGTAVAGPPPPPPLPAPVPAMAVSANYDSRHAENTPPVGIPELNNYFMGLNVGHEQIPQAATPAPPQMGYWGPSSNSSQSQGSSQMYYLPSSLPTGSVHPKYTPAAQLMYTYNVPPVVYPTDVCQSVMPNSASAVYPTTYYAAANNGVSYRTPTPTTPTAVTATTVTPTSFFVYHPQPAAPPPPPPIQFGMVRPQQQVPVIRSSPPPGPRARMPFNRSLSERTRHNSVNIDPKTANLQFSSSLPMYGLRLVPGEIQSLGMMRSVSNVRPVSGAHSSSNSTHHHHHHHHHQQLHHPVFSPCSGNESVLTASRPPRPRKQR